MIPFATNDTTSAFCCVRMTWWSRGIGLVIGTSMYLSRLSGLKSELSLADYLDR
jgi:hypothetical protein